MAVFGVPRVHEDDALRAVRAAAEMREALAELNEELERDLGRAPSRPGPGSTPARSSSATRPRGRASSLGDAVNVAARLEQAAEPGEILIGEATYRLVRDAVVAEAVGPLALKGKAEPVPAWRLLEVVPGARGWSAPARLAARRPRRELAALERAFDARRRPRRVRARHGVRPGRVGQVAPDARALARLGDEATVVAGRCLPYGEGITFWPIARRSRRPPGSASATGRERVAAQDLERLRRAGERRRARRRAARRRSSASTPATPRDPGDVLGRPPAVRAPRRASARSWSCSTTSSGREPTFLDLLEYLADWLRGAPVLLLCLARPELLEVRPGVGDAEGERGARHADAADGARDRRAHPGTCSRATSSARGARPDPRDGRGQPAVRRADAADARRRRGCSSVATGGGR